MNIFFSNRVEILYEHLKQALLATSPFSRRLVIVPSPAMKVWLTMRLANDPDVGISAGIDMLFIDQALQRLAQLFCKNSFQPIPSSIALTLQIEEKIKFHVEQPNQEKWEVIKRYLQGSQRKKERRLAALSERLAKLFTQYGIYSKELPSDHFQEDLWQELYQKYSPQNQFKQLSFQIPSGEWQIHLFALSFLPKLYTTFLAELAKSVPVNFWMMSPCYLFWSDLCSSKQATRLYNYWEKKGASTDKLQALDELLQDRNNLLANLGRLGREMARQIEDLDLVPQESYQLPTPALLTHQEFLTTEIEEEFTENPLTLLQALQADLVLGRNPKTNPKIALPNNDKTLQVHQHCSKLREIQELQNTLLSLIQENSSIHPSDIIVMAPQITDYVPFIKMVFGSSQSHLDFQMIDLPMPAQNSTAQAFQHLIKIAESRWEASSIFTLFEFESFQKKQRWSHEELMQLREWIQSSGIRWGNDAEHRQELLNDTITYHQGTWMDGIETLIKSLIFKEGDFSYTHIELLGQLLELLNKLKTDLRPLHDGSEKTMVEWSLLLKTLLETYFAYDSEESEEILITLDQLTKSPPEALFSFYSVQTHLESLFQQCEKGYRENYLQAVRFCSLMPMRAVPAKIIALIGLDETAFPRKTVHDSLNLLSKSPEHDYYPSQVDYDRYLFLEAILSARSAFILSYSSAPSLLIQELLEYLNEAFITPSQLIYVHPFAPFDPIYFSSPMRSYSMQHYKEALARNKHTPTNFISSFNIQIGSQNSSEDIWIDLKDLLQCARHPIKRYLNHVSKIYLEKSENVLLNHKERWNIEKYHLQTLLQIAFKSSLDNAIQYAEEQRLLPSAPLKNWALDQLETDYQETSTRLLKLGITPGSCYELRLQKNCTRETVGENCLILPPLDLGQIKIKGTLPLVSDTGLIHLAKNTFDEVVKSLPQFIVYQCLFPQKSILLKNKAEPLQDAAEVLKKYIDYYYMSHQSISPCMPKWFESIYKKDPELLKKNISKSLNDPFAAYEDEYLKWSLQSGTWHDPEGLVESWHPITKSLIEPIKDVWL